MTSEETSAYLDELLERTEGAAPKLLLLLQALGLSFDEGVALVGLMAGVLLSTATSEGYRDEKEAILTAFMKFGEAKMDRGLAASDEQERQGSRVN